MTVQKTARAFRWGDLAKDQPMPLVERQRVIGERVMLSHVVLRKGCAVPMHRHENEQFACVLSGKMRFQLGRSDSEDLQTVLVEGGGVVHFPSNVPHAAEALEDTVVLDVFSPPSEATGIDDVEGTDERR